MLAGLEPAQVVYVACDPVALARDTAWLLQCGYRLAHLEAFDLFPHTHHFECVARFVRD
jgi:tRNA/tmRNA/rRNA uracil-C5-methylase (TrmA/RlmC/RlmD family)